jgi:hypothetical protein
MSTPEIQVFGARGCSDHIFENRVWQMTVRTNRQRAKGVLYRGDLDGLASLTRSTAAARSRKPRKIKSAAGAPSAFLELRAGEQLESTALSM